ncbi:PASTA domain-containing protein [Nocardioides sp. T2.26MG-1]|uniref:PASTA domain-containing protein n=1 Tax=Nocardioides sp. T2.26MG-1 TaxID=3041166 RepID=UPI0024779866|nr:hypothetical protein [Nocardioides sp. T2.26MG-1]CAI9412027.1 hypothetical protein HIDPHFAB_01666 [Nocardioides sp. T2.26MG-1]
MDPQEYADARWHALLRTAVDLGVDEDDAPALVRQVLAAQHRRIRHAEDPDPLVQAALEDAVRGPREPRRPPWRAIGAAVAALAAVLAVVALTRPDEPPVDHLDDDQVPSVFGFGRQSAEDLLQGLGLEVTVEPVRACEVADRAIGTDPARGAAYDRGDPITLYTSIPANITCLTTYQQRSTTWQLVDLANARGPGPAFADRVFVYAGDGPATVLSGDEAADPEAWAETGVLDALREATSRVRLTDDLPLTYAVPALRIVRATEGPGDCGVPEPAVAGTGDAFAALIFSPTRAGCPLRVEVYRDDAHRVAAVALYAASS